jgi:uncharacterized protein
MTENLYSDSIRTYTGKYVDVFNPTPDMICIEDIAHALSNTPRFGGHLKHFYSVAQHSLSCAKCMDDYKLEALLHDASEAYLTDMPSPIKKKMPQYQEIEDNLMKVIAEKFGFQYPLPDEVHRIDKQMLDSEWRLLVLMNVDLTENVEKIFLETYFNLKR